VLPPSIAPVQVVLVPILPAASAGNRDHGAIIDRLQAMAKTLGDSGVRCHVDCREDVRPGAKFFEWERKGVPLRLVLGAKELDSGCVTMVERVSGRKETVALGENSGVEEVLSRVRRALCEVQDGLYRQAQDRLHARIRRVDSYQEMRSALQKEEEEGGGGGGFFLVPWKDCPENELQVKEDSKATLRCFPYDHNITPPGPDVKCFYSNEPATHMALFARAF
jgi:prolyl-tRNA synthetase